MFPREYKGARGLSFQRYHGGGSLAKYVGGWKGRSARGGKKILRHGEKYFDQESLKERIERGAFRHPVGF